MVVFLCKLVATISLRGGRLCGKNDSFRGSCFPFYCTAFIFVSHARLLAIVVTTSRICLKSNIGATACATGASILFQFGLANANNLKIDYSITYTTFLWHVYIHFQRV